MKRIRVFLFVIILFFLESTVIAQDNGCLIYEKMLYYLNKKEDKNKYTYSFPSNKLDPLNPVFVKEKDKLKRALSFYIVKEKQEFSTSAIKDWFSDFMKDGSIIKGEYTKYNDSISTCYFNNKIKYQFVEFKEVLSFTEKDYETKGTGKNIVYYTPMRILFSEILYSSNETALVFASVKTGSGGGEGNIYGFLFRKKRAAWRIQKSDIEMR